MLEINFAMHCCGVHELAGLSYFSTPESALLSMCTQIYPNPTANQLRYKETIALAKAEGHSPYDPNYVGGHRSGAVYMDVDQYSKFRFAIFTEARAPKAAKPLSEGYGYKFAELIEKERLGSLVSTAKHELNPNSGHVVKVWVWGIDHTALKRWYKKNGKEQSWDPKPMSAVIGNAVPAASPFVSPQAACGTTIAAVGSGQNLNNASGILGSNLRSTLGSR